MSSENFELEAYNEDLRPPCKYGVKCYQKNPDHLNKYKHPPKNTKRKNDIKEGTTKKRKVEEFQTVGDTHTISERSVETRKKECISDSSDEESTHKDETVKEALQKDLEQSGEVDCKTVKKEMGKKECISASSDEESANKEEITPKTTHKPFDPKKFIKSRFLVNMPDDFFNFWEFCKEMKPNNPSDALKDVGLKLVGAYDVLAGNFRHVKKLPEDYLRHWRYYYDPPEVQTVLKGDDRTGYHIGYFYDSPNEPPPFLVSNHGTKDGEFSKIGDNIFAAVSLYLEELRKTGDPFKKMHIGKVLSAIKAKAEKLNLNLSIHSPKIKEREKKVVAKTFNKIGLVVPYDKKTQLGYRELAMNDKELMTLLSKLEKAAPEQKTNYLSQLQPVITYANIAIDECDFGTGIKLGWEILYHGIDSLNSTILQFFCNAYKLLNRDAFAKIAEAHLSNRKKGCDLSIL